MAILLVGSVSALEFAIDNYKEVSENNKLIKYKDKALFSEDIDLAEFELLTNNIQIVDTGYAKVFEYKVKNQKEDVSKMIGATDYYNTRKGMLKINIDVDLKYKVITIIEETKLICEADFEGVDICKEKTYEKEVESWEDYKAGEMKQGKEIIISGWTNVNFGDRIEWVTNFYDDKMRAIEWAIWTAGDISLNSPVDDYFFVDNPVTLEGNASVTSGSGLLNISFWTNEGGWSRKDTTLFSNNTPQYEPHSVAVEQSNTAQWRGMRITIGDNPLKLTGVTRFGGADLPNRVELFDQTDGCTTMEATTSLSGNDFTFSQEHILKANNIYVFEFSQNNIDLYNAYRTQNSPVSVPVVETDFTWTYGTNADCVNGGGWINNMAGMTYELMDGSGEVEYNITVTDGVEWTIEACDGNDNCGFADENRSILVSDLAINLISPDNNLNTTSLNINFNCTAEGPEGVNSLNLTINDVVYNSVIGSGSTNLTSDTIETLTNGDYVWYCTANDDITTKNSTKYNLIVDNIAPTIIINSPTATETTETLPKNSSLNVTIEDAHLSTCWYYTNDNTTNITYSCNTVQNISFNTGGYKTIYAFANDTFGNENTTSTTYLINYIQENAIYETTIIEGESHSVILNITASDILTLNATLHYNGTDYSPTIVETGNTSLITSTFTVPTITQNELIYFNWTYTLNGIDYNSSNFNQTLIFLTPLVISASCDDKALKFDLQDEGNLSALTGDIKYNFKYGISNGSLKTVHGSLTGVTTFYACINATVSENYTLGYGEIQYRDGIYVDRRYYLFEGQTISNNTLTNHTLRDLLMADQTSFLLTMEDTSLNVYAEKYTALWRWYPDLDEYQIVGMGKTDDDGETVAHVQTEDVDYRVGLYERDGTLIKLDNPRRFVCTSAPCSLTIRVGAGDVDYSSVFDVQAEITYDEDTGVFLLIYNDPNQLTSEMRFLVTRETGTNTLIICNDTSSGFSGAMSCNTSMYNGLKKAVAYRSAFPELPIAQKVVSSINKTFNSGFGLFISVILWLAIVLSGFGNNPIWTIILAVVGLIPALIMGSINIAIFTAIAVLASIIIHFIKRTVAR